DDYGYQDARWVDNGEIGSLVDCPRYTAGVFDGGGGHLHPLNYAQGLAQAAQDAGAMLFENSEVTDVSLGANPSVTTDKGRVDARYVILAGNAYLPALGAQSEQVVRSRIMPVGTYIIATEPLDESAAQRLMGADAAVLDCNFVLNYYRLSADRRMLFGGKVSYSQMEPPNLAASLRRTMVHYLPSTADLDIEYCWGGNVAITINRTPHFGRLADNVYFAHGFSGHGVALTGMAGLLMAEAIAGTAERFDVFTRIPHRAFPGGQALRMPALVLAMIWYRLRDLL
ncbi:MAG: FAD-binding oxidoreductase, partial [Pseudomonadota bacterium]